MKTPCCFLAAALSSLLLTSLQSCAKQASPAPSGKIRLTAHEIAVIVNQADPLSVEIAQYYQQQRQIPPQNMISVHFPPGGPVLSVESFNRIKAEVDRKTPAYVQGFALTWVTPYRVDCMSVTAAFAFGFDRRYCANGCAPTLASPYFNRDSNRPFNDFHLRPTMAIAATNFAQAKALIDRGVAADGTYPAGTAYLLETQDLARSVRTKLYPEITRQLGIRFPIKVLHEDVLEGKPDVMFYFTGLSQVPKLTTNQFLPGAIADHLTSAGGMLTDSFQMSSLRWLEAGATGSYGAVVEPCNYLQKFPHPGVAISYYLAGDTLLEAYWKSVSWVGQGIFVGEPLARPFGQSPAQTATTESGKVIGGV